MSEKNRANQEECPDVSLNEAEELKRGETKGTDNKEKDTAKEHKGEGIAGHKDAKPDPKEAPDTDSAQSSDGETDSDEASDSQESVDAEDSASAKGAKKDKNQQKIDDLNDRLMRQMAEFENFRKRSEKEKAQMFETGARSIIEKILPVVDNFERGLAAIPKEGSKDPFAEGMEMVYRQLMTELESLGVKPIEAVGCEFNPDFHNAVMQTQSEEFESGIIAQELQKGYMYRESVVRHSMVAVVE